MNIGIITTSRADFGIYIPLLNQIKNKGHQYLLFVGGMHNAVQFGSSYQLIEKEGFDIAEKIDGLINDDSQEGVAVSMANTLSGYGKIWSKYKEQLDVVFVLGDRYEMYAATSSLVPFNIPIAHLHGGETTLGAIDNKFRHAITMLSDFHFPSHEVNAEKIKQMTGTSQNTFNVGALAIEGMLKLPTLNFTEFFNQFNFDISSPFVLTTIHPETVALEGNAHFINEFLKAVVSIDIPVLCTLPNADPAGSIIRSALQDFEQRYPKKLRCFENLGQKGYFSAMKHCSLMIGNTSSGIIEAASFNKYVLNLGDRQKGRLCGDNVIHVPFLADEIGKAFSKYKNKTSATVNPYGTGETSIKIMNFLSKMHEQGTLKVQMN